MTRPRKRRQYATGSVYQRSSDGKWLGVKDHGYTRSGGRRRVTVTANTEAEAKRKLEQKIRALNSGSQSGGRMTVKAYMETWLAATEEGVVAKAVRPNTATADRSAAAWIIETIGHKRLDQLTPADVKSFTQTVLAGRAGRDGKRKPLALSTAHRYRGTLDRMLKAARADGHAVPESVLEVVKPGEGETGREAMTVPEALAVLAQAAERPDGVRWLLALVLGMRQGECLGLLEDRVRRQQEDIVVDWQRQEIPYKDRKNPEAGFRVSAKLRHQHLVGNVFLIPPKTKKGFRLLPLLPIIEKGLDRWAQVAPSSPYGLVFPAADGKPRRPDDDLAEWHALQAAAGVAHPSGRPYHLHEARHTTATLLLALGVEESTRIQILGWAAVVRAYEHDDITRARKALTKLAKRLELG